MKTWKAVAGFAFLMGASSTASALCAGFTDVDGASPFCPNVEWLKNRGVTTGCTSATLYCPTDVVTRLSMAAFMNRLGNALEPAFLNNSQSATATINASGVSCQTTAYVVANYPRIATARGMLYHSASTSQLVTARLVYSLNGGTTWNSFSDFYTLATNVPNGFITQSPVAKGVVLNVGASVIFGIRSGEFGGAPTVGDSGCSITVRLDSHTGASSPFDEDPAPVQTH